MKDVQHLYIRVRAVGPRNGLWQSLRAWVVPGLVSARGLLAHPWGGDLDQTSMCREAYCTRRKLIEAARRQSQRTFRPGLAGLGHGSGSYLFGARHGILPQASDIGNINFEAKNINFGHWGPINMSFGPKKSACG